MIEVFCLINFDFRNCEIILGTGCSEIKVDSLVGFSLYLLMFTLGLC